MAMTMKMEGLEELEKMLSEVSESAQGIASLALYDGAGIMADEIKREASTIRTEPFRYAKTGTRLPSPEEKAIVEQASAGIAKFNKNGTEVDTSVGYRNAGYAMLGNKEKPIPQIVNAINSGTSFMNKQPFVRKAAKKGGTKAINAMKAKIEEAFDEITGGKTE
jgi:HK97 gp10 family phage protein